MRGRVETTIAAAVIVAASLAACSSGDPKPDIELDGSPRVADEAGIVDAVNLESITIDGEERDLSEHLAAFSTYTLAAVPIVETRGAYVHAGVDDGKVVWVAVIGRAVSGDGRSIVLYNGTVRAVTDDRVRFDDGTVLVMEDGLRVPPAGAKALVQIDVENDRVVQLDGE